MNGAEQWLLPHGTTKAGCHSILIFLCSSTLFGRYSNSWPSIDNQAGNALYSQLNGCQMKIVPVENVMCVINNGVNECEAEPG
jgi:hypothetical protein